MTYEIILIESFSVNRNGDMEIVAILENMGKQTVRQTLYDPPEYAPARCKTIVSADALPEPIKFRGGKFTPICRYVLDRRGVCRVILAKGCRCAGIVNSFGMIRGSTHFNISVGG